jgi:hypothetical protein
LAFSPSRLNSGFGLSLFFRLKNQFLEGVVRTLPIFAKGAVYAVAAWLVLVCWTLQSSAQQGGLTVQLDLARMVDESENVVLARVTSVTAEKHPEFENLDTDVIA